MLGRRHEVYTGQAAYIECFLVFALEAVPALLNRACPIRSEVHSQGPWSSGRGDASLQHRCMRVRDADTSYISVGPRITQGG
jgi:hypothetical protein